MSGQHRADDLYRPGIWGRVRSWLDRPAEQLVEIAEIERPAPVLKEWHSDGISVEVDSTLRVLLTVPEPCTVVNSDDLAWNLWMASVFRHEAEVLTIHHVLQREHTDNINKIIEQ